MIPWNERRLLKWRAFDLAINFAYLGRKYYGLSELMDLCYKALK